MAFVPDPARRPADGLGERQLVRTPPPTLLQRAARGLLALFGWRVDVRWPPPPKAVIAVYPHTSNWDFVIGILARAAVGLRVSWIGKDTIFRWPFGALFRKLGGLPVNRREHQGVVAQMQAEFARRPFLWLAIAPEGTRAHTDHWKSGFYRLACAAGVPLGLGYLDYGRRVGRDPLPRHYAWMRSFPGGVQVEQVRHGHDSDDPSLLIQEGKTAHVVAAHQVGRRGRDAVGDAEDGLRARSDSVTRVPVAPIARTALLLRAHAGRESANARARRICSRSRERSMRSHGLPPAGSRKYLVLNESEVRV